MSDPKEEKDSRYRHIVSEQEITQKCKLVLLLGSEACDYAIENMAKTSAKFFSETNPKEVDWALGFEDFDTWLQMARRTKRYRREIQHVVIETPAPKRDQTTFEEVCFRHMMNNLQDLVINQKSFRCIVTILMREYVQICPNFSADVDWIWFRPGPKLGEIVYNNFTNADKELITSEISLPSLLCCIDNRTPTGQKIFAELDYCSRNITKLLFFPESDTEEK